MDHQSAFEQRTGQTVEQRGPIAGVDLDHGELVRCLVVEQNPWRDIESTRTAVRQRTLRQSGRKIDLVRQRIGDAAFQPFQLAFFGKGFTVGILHEEIVECPAHPRGVDAGIDDVSACEMDAAGNSIEHARMVGRDYRDQRCTARFVIFAVNGKLMLPFARGSVVHQVQRDDIDRFSDPVCVAHGLGQICDEMALFPENVCHLRLLVRDCLFATMPHVPQPQALARYVVKFAQQLALPTVPSPWADRAYIDRGEDCEMPQPFLALHLTDEIFYCLGVGKIALLRRVAHQQVIENQPGHHPCFALAQAETRAQISRNFRPEHGMVAPAALGDIV